MADTVDSERVREFSENEESLERKLDELAALIRASKYTVFYTGAGVSTSAGVGDYRGPSGAWTMRKIRQLEKNKNKTPEEEEELQKLLTEAAREQKKAKKEVGMLDAQPTATHMAQATLIRLGLGHFVVTTNLDGIYRKAGLKGHSQLCCLHGDVYIERCTACKYDFERNYEVRQGNKIHVHDHKVGNCSKCGSKTPKHYTGMEDYPKKIAMKKSKWGGQLIGTNDEGVGTKDTHINFGEYLDPMDWDEAEQHCGKADLCIVAGTSMSLRHITHFPFMAKKTCIINLQATPDDERCDLRIWAQCDPVFVGLMDRLGIEIDPVPVWRPADMVAINKIPKHVNKSYVEAAQRLNEMIAQREAEAKERKKLRKELAKKAGAAGGAGGGAPQEAGPAPGDEDEKNDEEVDGNALVEPMAAASVSPREKAPIKLEIGNEHEPLLENGGRNQHRWCCFVRSADGTNLTSLIDKVVFELHPTFSPSSATVSQAPFQITMTGWGTFEVGVTVYWKSQGFMKRKRPPSKVGHQLDFSVPLTSRVYEIS